MTRVRRNSVLISRNWDRETLARRPMGRMGLRRLLGPMGLMGPMSPICPIGPTMLALLSEQGLRPFQSASWHDPSGAWNGFCGIPPGIITPTLEFHVKQYAGCHDADKRDYQHHRIDVHPLLLNGDVGTGTSQAWLRHGHLP